MLSLVSTKVFYLVIGAYPLPAYAQNFTHESADCLQAIIPVRVTAQNAVYNVSSVDNNVQAVDFIQELDTWSSPSGIQRVIRNFTVNDTYPISAQLCHPRQASNRSRVLQIATHGIAFDKTYWDIQQSPEEYSYVSAALKAGFSILTYDRLGTGSSGKPDAYDIVQSSLELEILRSLTLRARSGKLLSHMKSEDCPGDLKAASQGFEKFVHVGHSLGSFLSTALVSAHPELSDAIVLTGFVVNGHILDTHEGQFGWELAKSNNAQRFGDRGSGYLVPGNENAMHEIFFKDGPQLDEEMISYSDRIKQTATVGELMTYRTLDTSGSRQFDGPIQFVVGEYDVPICGGDCKDTFRLSDLQAMYPRARSIDAFIQPGTGHGITLHKNATAGYKLVFDYLGRQGF